jgi:uncharacterized protein with GYD domain
MPRGVILVDYTDQGRRGIKDSPNRAEASKAEAAKLGVQVKDLFYTPGGPHDAAIVVEAASPEPIHKFMASVQSLGNVKMKFVRAFSIEEMRKMV